MATERIPSFDAILNGIASLLFAKIWQDLSYGFDTAVEIWMFINVSDVRHFFHINLC